MKKAIMILAALAAMACDEEADPVLEYEKTTTYDMRCDDAKAQGLIPDETCLNGNTYLVVWVTNVGDPSGHHCTVSELAMPCHGCNMEAEDMEDICLEDEV